MRCAASSIVHCIKIQQKLTYPLGIILRRTGSKPKRTGKNCGDVVINPHKAFSQGMISHWLLPTLPFWEKKFFNISTYDPSRLSMPDRNINNNDNINNKNDDNNYNRNENNIEKAE